MDTPTFKWTEPLFHMVSDLMGALQRGDREEVFELRWQIKEEIDRQDELNQKAEFLTVEEDDE